MAERLIDAEAFERELENFSVKEINLIYDNPHDRMVARHTVGEVTYLLNNAPTIEAKPVVYCKECKYNVANSKHEPLDITDYTDIVCEYFMTDGMSPNDYCSQGVKIPVISMEDVPKIMEEMENENSCSV